MTLSNNIFLARLQMSRRLMSNGIVHARCSTVSSVSYPTSQGKKLFVRLAPHRKQGLIYEKQQ